MEHAVYICGWRKTRRAFVLWTEGEPRIQVEAPAYLEAETMLLEAIREQGGAMHAVLEFDPPLPRTELESKFSAPELFMIGGDDVFVTDAPRAGAFETDDEREGRLGWLDKFFERSLCRECFGPVGRRTGNPIRLTEFPSRRTDGAFGAIGSNGTTRVQIVSEEFLELLSDEERCSLVFQTVEGTYHGRRFFELIGNSPIPFVAVAGLPIIGWCCPVCGFSVWGCWIKGFAIHEFVAAADLASPLPSMFTVGGSAGIQLCVRGDRWRELVGKKGVRGFVSRPLGVVKDRELLRHPELSNRDQLSSRR